MNIVMPPCEANEVEAIVAKIMEEYDEAANSYGFYDYYTLISHGLWDNKDMVTTVADLTKDDTAFRVLVVGKNSFCDLSGVYMVVQEAFNGLSYNKTDWDCTVLSAIDKAKERISYYLEGVRDSYTPKDDWLVVKIDYHS
jgi:hypothetical protein